MIITIPQPVLTPEQVQAANLDRRIILFTSDADRIAALRRYWQILLEVAALNTPFPDDFPTLIGALALQKTQVTNDLENAKLYVKNRALSASLQTCAAAIAREKKRHHHVIQQRLAPDKHNGEFVRHSDAMIRLNDAHEAAQLAGQACAKFEHDLSHLMNVREYLDDLAAENPESAARY